MWDDDNEVIGIVKVLNEHGVGLSECCALIAIMTQLKITFEIQNQSPQKLGAVASHC